MRLNVEEDPEDLHEPRQCVCGAIWTCDWAKDCKMQDGPLQYAWGRLQCGPLGAPIRCR